MEHDEKTDELEHEADSLEHDSEQLGERIAEARQHWEAKQQDPSVPGAQGDPARVDSPGMPGEEGTATGNPDAAGAEDPDSSKS